MGDGGSPAQGARGRGADFAGMVRLHAAPLYRYCYGRLKDRQLAEDAVQETFLRTYRSLKGGRQEGVSGWLFGVARNCCLEIWRERARGAGRVRTAGGLAELAAAGRAAPAAAGVAGLDPAGPGAAAESGGEGAEIEAALERLPEEQRSLIYLKHTRGLKCREIARITGQPLGTVTANLARSYQKLREILGGGRQAERGGR